MFRLTIVFPNTDRDPVSYTVNREELVALLRYGLVRNAGADAEVSLTYARTAADIIQRGLTAVEDRTTFICYEGVL